MNLKMILYIIGFVLIFVLILALNLLMPQMIKWVNTQTGGNTINQTEITNAQYEAFDPGHRALRGSGGFSTEDDDGEETQLDIADESQSPELLLESSLTRDAVRRGLDALPPDYRQILLLREIQGLSYEEIAAALGIESGTVKSRIFRARKRLCTFLIEDGNIPDFQSSGRMKGGEKQ